MFFILCECGIIPICIGKNGMLLVFSYGGLDQSVQNRLLVFKMAVERRLADTNRFRQLGNGSGLIPLHGKQFQRGIQYPLLGGSFCCHGVLLLGLVFPHIIPTER